MTHSNDDIKIKTNEFKKCLLCGEMGERRYTKLRDRLFDVTGEWHLNQCANPSCGLVWLDPRPVLEDVVKLYENYITHDAEAVYKNKPNSFFRRILLYILKGVNIISFERFTRKNFYLLNTKPGRLLEIGCGDGHNLALLRNRGWDVVGQEIDPHAARVAKTKYKCKVHIGALEEIAFPDNSFDAIITNHVLEHLYDPESTFNECYRILKPKGNFVSITPNINSLGHKFFKKDWVGLDVPRHLQIFSKTTLKSLSKKIGFNKCRCWTTNVNTALLDWISFDIKTNVNQPMTNPRLCSGLKSLIFKLYGSVYLLTNRDSGEECVLFLEK